MGGVSLPQNLFQLGKSYNCVFTDTISFNLHSNPEK